MHRYVLAVYLIAAAGAWFPPQSGLAQAQDVRAFCRRAGDDDRLRMIPSALISEARQLFGFSAGAPAAWIQKSTSFRCMAAQVWLCNYGANLVCGRANARRSSPGARKFCEENPGADAVPMTATGHDTIYEWKCAGKTAQISRQIETADPRGFIAGNWKRLK